MGYSGMCRCEGKRPRADHGARKSGIPCFYQCSKFCQIMLEFPNYAPDFRSYAHKMTQILQLQARNNDTTLNYDVFQSCCCKFICVLWRFGSTLSCPNQLHTSLKTVCKMLFLVDSNSQQALQNSFPPLRPECLLGKDCSLSCKSFLHQFSFPVHCIYLGSTSEIDLLQLKLFVALDLEERLYFLSFKF